MIRECIVCKKEFEICPAKVKAGYGKFCSRICWGKFQRNRIERQCLTCGKSISVKPCDIKRGGGKYCSKECYCKSQLSGRQVTCKYCGKIFYATRKAISRYNAGKYCSWDCFQKDKKKNTKFMKTKCDYCGKEIYKWRRSIKRNNLQFCSRKCKKEYFVGERAVSWLGGISFEPYTPEFNRQLKELIRYRDGYKCQKCSMSEIENIEKLSIHHIDYEKKNCKPLNLISLCGSCNSKVNFNRSKWIKYFQKKVEKIMNSNAIQLNFRYKDNKTKQFIRR